jgi:uncharacterized membrane protein
VDYDKSTSIFSRFKEDRYIFLPIICTIVFLIASVYIHSGRLFWLDELYTLRTLQSKSVVTLIQGFWNGQDTNPPLYFILLYLYASILGGSEFILLVFSFLWFLTSVVSMYAILRKFVSRGSAVTAIFFFSVSPLGFYLLGELRPYGLLMFLTTMMIYYYDLLKSGKDSTTIKFFFIFYSTAMLYTHYFAFIYYLVLLCLEFLQAFTERKYRILAIVVVPACLFLPWLPAMRNQLIQIHSIWWQTIPSVSDLISLPSFWFGKYGVIMIATVFVAFLISRQDYRAFVNKTQNRGVILLLCSFLITPLIVFLLARFDMLIFKPRYFIPTSIAIVIILGMLIQGVHVNKRIMLIISTVIICCLGIVRLKNQWIASQDVKDSYKRLIDLAERGKPILCESPHVFYPLEYELAKVGLKNAFLPLDSLSASLSVNGQNSLFDYYQVQSSFFRDSNIVPQKKFLSHEKEFYVINESRSMYFENRIKDNPFYSVQNISDSLYFVKIKDSIFEKR